ARRPRSRHDGALPRARHRRVLRPLAGEGRAVRRRTRTPATGREARGRAARRARRRGGDAARAVRGVRHHEASLLRRRGIRARHRLHRRRVSERRGCHAAPLQGRPRPPRGRQPRHEARLREGVPTLRPAGLRGGRAARADGVRGLRDARIWRALLLLQPGARGREPARPHVLRAACVTPTAPPGERSVLRDQDPVVFIDRKERSYLRILRRGGRISVRGQAVPCDAVIGLPEGSRVETAGGERLLVVRPTYAQLIPSLPRRAEPIYPKDAGPILLWGDIGPGMHVVEVGTGPGALTLALLRAVGPTGRLTSYEARDDFATLARENVARYHGAADNWTLRVADAFEGLD